MVNFDPCNIFLAITTNIPQRLKTGFVVQGHIWHLMLTARIGLKKNKEKCRLVRYPKTFLGL